MSIRNFIGRPAVAVAAASAVLAVSAVSYALYTESVDINGTVQTGTLSMRWSDAATVSDNENATTGDQGQCSFTPQNKTMVVTLTNAYPGYECVLNANILNDGTVSSKITNVAFGAHNPKIIMRDSGSQAQTNTTFQPGDSKLYRLTVRVDETATEADLPENGGPFSVPVDIDFANIHGAPSIP